MVLALAGFCPLLEGVVLTNAQIGHKEITALARGCPKLKRAMHYRHARHQARAACSPKPLSTSSGFISMRQCTRDGRRNMASFLLKW
jgi:hypothetical protein